MGCFIPPLIGLGEHLFEQAASTQMVVGPFTVRPDGIKDDHAARQYIGQVVGIVRMIETTVTGKALVGGASEQDFDRVFAPQEVIVHELVHVARAVSGNFGRLDDDEEELASMVANMFSIEIGRPPVKSYDDESNVTGDVAAFSRAYYKANFDMIEAFCKQNRELAIDLSHANVAFNPLRQYIAENF